MKLQQQVAAGTIFADDISFLEKHVDVVILENGNSDAKVALIPDYQGRVMTSTVAGEEGLSFGWINRELIASGEKQDHINVYGGEDRFWIGPEGGQFSIFFAKGAKFDLDHWYTPPPIDTHPFKLVRHDLTSADFEHEFSLNNYSGTPFDLKVERKVRLLTGQETWQKFGLKPVSGPKVVAFESINKITNTGSKPWTKETGLLSIWILGMFNPSPATTIVVPINTGPDSQLGTRVTSDYFSKVPASHLAVKDNVVYFSGDGNFRSKIGFSPMRSKAVLGSFDAANHVLTVVQFKQPTGVVDYVNSHWKLQDDPYAGDASNSYNDGPPSPGAKPLGPFYELETSSPAAALKPGESIEHVHRTAHFVGGDEGLDTVARATLGVSLKEAAGALLR